MTASEARVPDRYDLRVRPDDARPAHESRGHAIKRPAGIRCTPGRRAHCRRGYGAAAGRLPRSRDHVEGQVDGRLSAMFWASRESPRPSCGTSAAVSQRRRRVRRPPVPTEGPGEGLREAFQKPFRWPLPDFSYGFGDGFAAPPAYQWHDLTRARARPAAARSAHSCGAVGAIVRALLREASVSPPVSPPSRSPSTRKDHCVDCDDCDS